ncbi:TrbC/VirB2 family protein [Variovorax sp. KK3]|uniref:TrbC/VirB2 family protein n=1 Tax=Variovorax sp. KK3 TaxID=1855728 RepID=UPI0009FA49FE|nr:TrbC/VirB2 family protein [Variovorax sp. KK3]
MRYKKQWRGKSGLRAAAALATILVIASPAYAQFERGTQALTRVQTWFLSIGVILVSLAIMFVGARMAFHAAKWSDVAPVFWGGVLLGGGSAFASLFF